MQFGTPRYGLTRHLPGLTLSDARARVVAALQSQGFGVLTEIDMQATMKAKLNADIPPYIVLGACNPRIALAALSVEPGIGLLLPCNVVLTGDDRGVTVSAVDPEAMFSVVDRPDVAPLADEVKGLLSAALDAL